jgi:replicative DNA helicase
MNEIHEPKQVTDYIFNEPNAESCRETYATSSEELLEPFPSVLLYDFPKLTRLTGGLRAREFSIICGSTGVGKTTLNANLSKSLISQGIPHFVASVETGRTDYMKRIMSALAGEDWNTGDSVKFEKLKNFYIKHGSLFEAESMWLSLYENRFSVETLMNDIAWMVHHKKCKVAIIDNLNFFLEVSKGFDQIYEMDKVIHKLIIFCKEVDVHIIMVMHPRKNEHGRVESEFDVKGSATAVQEAHNVFLFNRAGEDLISQGFASKFDRELKIAKMRRKGRAVGSRLILKGVNGVLYTEGEIV